jgi:hypothetical protein
MSPHLARIGMPAPAANSVDKAGTSADLSTALALSHLLSPKQVQRQRGLAHRVRRRIKC